MPKREEPSSRGDQDDTVITSIVITGTHQKSKFVIGTSPALPQVHGAHGAGAPFSAPRCGGVPFSECSGGWLPGGPVILLSTGAGEGLGLSPFGGGA